MATGAGTGFDFSGLNKACKEIDKRIGDIIRKGNTMEQSLTKNFQNIAKNGVEPFINKLQQINTSLGGTSKVVDMINRIVMAFNKLKGDTKVGVSTKDGDEAIKKLQKEIAQLQKQQEKTAQQVDKWKNKYDKLSQSVKRGGDNAKNFQETQSKMLDTAGQLKRALAAAFSVSAIKGYMNKLMQVRGEFELQQRSLQVLLQNKDEANALWDKTVALAVKSPYTTKQLVTATKQLAAYRVESEKLYETNKMLADVSIGLGVDMNRLILAFGQVKAANFLRGCLGKGTKIQMFDGSVKNVEDVIVGDVILGDDNTERVVSEIIRGREQMYKVCSKDGLFNEYRVNENHILTLFDIEEQKNVDVYVTEYLENQNRYLGATQKGVYAIVVTKDIVDEYYGFVIDKNKRFVIENGIITHNTELRQFSEAGVNMLDELAKRFTMLEGRAVSVGEVFERVSKRMVSFADVEAVFKTITSEGGTFYQMQEKQSETLKGMMLNLKDSYELMLNDIGKESEGRLKGFVSTMRFLVDNWRELAFILEKVVVSYASFKVVNATYVLGMKKASEATLWFNKGLKAKVGSVLSDIQAMTWQEAKIMGVTRAQYAAGKATMYLQGAIRGLWAGIKMAIPFALVGIALELWRVITKASREAERLRNELNNIVSGDVADLDKTIDRYTNLATRLDKVNKGSDAHREIISKLNSEYGEYLNFVVTEETTMQNLADAYENVVKVMKEKQALASFEKGMNAISQSYGNALTDAKEDFYDLFEGASIKSKTDKFKFLVPTEKEIDDIYAIIQQRTKELDANQFDSLKEQADLIQEVVSGYYGGEFFLSRDFSQSIELLDILVKRKEQEKELQEEINAIYKEVLHSREAQLELEKLQNEYAEKRRKIEGEFSGYEKEKALAELADEQELAVIDLKLRFNLIEEPEATKQKDAIINWAKGTIADINNRLKNELSPIFSEEELSKVLFTRHIKDSKTINDYLKDITNNWKQQNEIITEQISLKSELGSLDEANENILQTALRKEELYRRTAELLGVELKYTERLSEEMRNAINAILPEEYQISLEQAYGGIDKIIADLKKEEAQHLNIIEQINERKKEGLPFNEQELKDAEDAYWWTKKRLDLIDPKTKTPISEGKVNTINAKLEEKYQIDAVDRTKDEVTLLSEANSEKEKAIAYEKQLNAQKEQGHNITKEELDAAKKDVEQYTLLWKLLGGTEKETTGRKERSNSLYDERIKVIDDLNKKYQELNKTLDKSTSLQGAFDAYIDAFSDAYEGISWIPKNVRQMTAEEFVENVLNFPNEDALVEFLDRLAKEPMKTFEKIKVELAKGEYVMDMRVETKQAADKQIADEIASMFDGYEISLELDKLNIPKDLASRLFGIEDIDLSDIRKRIEQEIYNAQLKGGQEDFIAKRKEELEKVKDMEIKQQRELLKTYSKYLVQAQSERIKIKLDELRQLKEIESLEIGDADKELMRQGVQKDIQKRLDTQAWKDFQESGMYVRLFDNLEGASMHSLDKMENALMALRDSLKDLDPSELKEINNQLEKIRDIKVDKNPFKGLADDAKTYFEYVKNRKEWEASLDASEKKEANIRSEADSQSLLIKSLEDELDLIDQTTDEGIAYALVLESKVELEKEYLKVLLDELEAQGKITREERERIENGQDAGKSIQDRLNKTAQEISAVTSSMADMATNLEAAFGMSDSLKDTFELLQGIGGGVSDIYSGAAGLFSGNPLQMIQGGMQLVSGVSKIFASFNEAHDKRIERKIESEIKLVERLGKLYEKLEKQIETAYSIDTFQAANDAAKENLEQQIRATERMIEAEKDKKKTDQKRIDEWREQIEENLELLEELEAKRLQELGGIGGEDAYKDIAQGFTDAWFDAFLETGNGLDALNDHFDEVLNNMVKKQLTLRATDSFLAPIFEEIDKAVKDTKVTNEEMRNIKELAAQTMPELAAFLENIATEMGMSEYAGKNGELSGLSAGIQGMSAEQADIISAYLNTLRFYVADSNMQLKALVAAQGVNADTPNPMLSQLLVIAEQTRAIRDMFESVIGRGGNNKHGGAYLKVDIG